MSLSNSDHRGVISKFDTKWFTWIMNEMSNKMIIHLLWDCPATQGISRYHPDFVFVVLKWVESSVAKFHLFLVSTLLCLLFRLVQYYAKCVDVLLPAWIACSTGTMKNFVDYLWLTSKLWACSNYIVELNV